MIWSPQEQEPIQSSKDPPVVMTANGVTHTTEEATTYAYDLDMFVQVQSLYESTCSTFTRELFEENGYSYEWHPGRPS